MFINPIKFIISIWSCLVSPYGCAHMQNQFESFRPNPFYLCLCCKIYQKMDETSTSCWQCRQTVWMHSVEHENSDWMTRLLGWFNPLTLSLKMPQEANYLIQKGLQGQPASVKPSPFLTILHSQKVLIHNQNVYCFEQTTFPSAPFLLAMENSWEGFNISVTNLKAVLKTPFKCLFHWLNKLDSFSICQRERSFSTHLALWWESYNNFGMWALRGQEWPLVKKLCKVILRIPATSGSLLNVFVEWKRRVRTSAKFQCLSKHKKKKAREKKNRKGTWKKMDGKDKSPRSSVCIYLWAGLTEYYSQSEGGLQSRKRTGFKSLLCPGVWPWSRCISL